MSEFNLSDAAIGFNSLYNSSINLNDMSLRIDIDDCDPKEQWDEFIFIQDELRRFGITLSDPQVEHDCITGKVVKL